MCLVETAKNKGIILKRFTTGFSRVSLFDQHLGKIDAFFHHEATGYGTVIQYALKERFPSGSVRFTLSSVELFAVPLKLAQTELTFLHRVLEICYYFIPIGSSVPTLFELILFLYDIDRWKHVIFFQDLFLCKLLITLGFFPEESRFKTAWFCRLAAVPIDTLLTEHVDLAQRLELRTWIRACLNIHPLVRYFKTVCDMT